MIRNIIFDLGGVILNINFPMTVEAFRKLGIENIDEIYTGYVQNKFFDSFDRGLISESDFINELKSKIPESISDQQILDAWNSMLRDFPADRVELLKDLKVKYKLFMLSNTNSIHFSVYNKQLKDTFGISDLSQLFDKSYFSFQLGMRKPDLDIYNYVLENSRIIAGETLFIDDSVANIKAAEKLGIRTLLYDGSVSLRNVLAGFGIE